jgi:hypothetical protein
MSNHVTGRIEMSSFEGSMAAQVSRAHLGFVGEESFAMDIV